MHWQFLAIMPPESPLFESRVVNGLAKVAKNQESKGRVSRRRREVVVERVHLTRSAEKLESKRRDGR